jgi:hypothetical protein
VSTLAAVVTLAPDQDFEDPARGPGFWLVTINRGRSDGLSGFTGRVIRSRVRSEVEDGTRAALTATKSRLE